MRYQQNEQQFQSIANTIWGKWRNMSTDETIIFSPATSPLDVCDMLTIKDGNLHVDYYLLGYYPNNEVYIVMGQQINITRATIKVITDDTLIMQMPNCNMIVYERTRDTAFADALIEAL